MKKPIDIAFEILDSIDDYPFEEASTALVIVLKSIISVAVPKEKQEIVVDKVASAVKESLKRQ